MIRSIVTTAILCTSIAGCAIRPIPENVTALDTWQIVQKIRCEFRDSVRTRFRNFTEDTAFHEDTDKETSEKLLDILSKLNKNEIEYADALVTISDKSNNFPEDYIETIDRFSNAAIAYDFDFDMTEDNNSDLNAGLAQTWPRFAPLTIDIDTDIDAKRNNKRTFRIVDTFNRLATLLPDRICTGVETGKNFAFPMGGNLNLDEMVTTFLDLDRSANLSVKNDGIPTLSDVLTFTTQLTGKSDLKLNLAPVGPGFDLADVGFTNTNIRKDIHKLTITMTLPRKKDSREFSENEKRALEELERQRTLEIDSENKTIRDILLSESS